MSDSDPVNVGTPLSELAPEVRAARASSFGGAAAHYERFRPGPPTAAVDWLLPVHVERVVDLGAGTGALTRLLVDRADEVVAVEPDDRMRAVLTEQVPGAHAVNGRGESMPLPDSSANAVLASSSWHWMDPVPTLAEVARVLVDGGTLGAVWSGPDPEGAFAVQAKALLAQESEEDANGVAGVVVGGLSFATPTLEIPDGLPFDAPERQITTWDVALNADELIGLLGTMSWIITMTEDRRTRVLTEARRLLSEILGVEGETTIDVGFRADTWRTHLTI